MLKIINMGSKKNFVDDNNMVVGYDTQQDCCEQCDYYFTQHPTNAGYPYDSGIGDPIDLFDKLSFDPDFFQEESWAELEDGKAVIFKLVGDKEPWYLVIYNSHNGYYAHGFDVTVGGILQREGYI